MDFLRRDLLKFSPFALAGFAPVLAQSPRNQFASALLFDVRTFGATGAGKNLDTPAINNAIEAAAAAGGGTVFFPAGTYLCFSIRLKSHVDLYLAQGAVILAAESPKPGETTGYMGGTYDAAEPKTAWDAYQDYGHNHWHNSLIWGENINDISITGPGLIYGKGLSFGAGPGRPPGVPQRAGFGPESGLAANGQPRQQQSRHRAQRRPSAPSARRAATTPCTRPSSPASATRPSPSRTAATSSSATFPSSRAATSASCSPASTTSPSTTSPSTPTATAWTSTAARTSASPTAPSTRPGTTASAPNPAIALGYNRATENVTITNCYRLRLLPARHRARRHLQEVRRRRPRRRRAPAASSAAPNPTAASRTSPSPTASSKAATGLALESEDGALCEDIAISNITMRDLITGPLFFRLGSRLRGPEGQHQSRHAPPHPRLEHRLAQHSLARLPNILTGIPGFPIEDIKISNIFIAAPGRHGAADAAARSSRPRTRTSTPTPACSAPCPPRASTCATSRNLEMSHVEVAPIAPDARPSFYLEVSTAPTSSAITAPTPDSLLLPSLDRHPHSRKPRRQRHRPPQRQRPNPLARLCRMELRV